MSFNKLKNGYSPRAKFFTSVKSFSPLSSLNKEDVKEAFDFAFEMAFGSTGEHRAHRSGGSHQRKPGEIFANTFQGKLCEFAIYETFIDKFEINKPDLETYGLGKWDEFDFVINKKLISVKSTKSFGNLLLLETKDWNSDGEYIPSNKKYDFTFLVRIKNDPETILRRVKKFYSLDEKKEELWDLFENNDWSFDIPGFISNEELCFLIKEGFIIYRGDYLNGKTRMDATNYYCQTGDMHNINEFKG